MLADPATAPHEGAVLVIDDSGDRKDGTKTAHVGHQWLGRYGKTGSGVVTVTTLWADERLYYPVHAVPYTPARHFGKGKNDPAFRTKLAIGADLAVKARDAGFVLRLQSRICMPDLLHITTGTPKEGTARQGKAEKGRCSRGIPLRISVPLISAPRRRHRVSHRGNCR